MKRNFQKKKIEPSKAVADRDPGLAIDLCKAITANSSRGIDTVAVWFISIF